MKIGIISAGQLGSAYAKRWAKAGHQVILTNSGDLSKLNPRLAEIGANASHELVEANGDSNFAFTVTHFTKAA